MESTSDILLFLSCLEDIYLDKAFIKKLVNLSYFPKIFNENLSKVDLKFSAKEIEKIIFLKTQIKKIDLSKIKEILNRKNIGFVALGDKSYPLKLSQINDPPLVLFYKGDLKILFNSKTVAIVGTRTATDYGKNISKMLASLLAKEKIIVVSGLASGIDTCAHVGTFNCGKTVAVLGTGPDTIFPACNTDVYNKILSYGGLIVSEYKPGTSGLPWNFPQRNRIISGLSDAIVVVEGDLQSGALITARFAIKQNKPLFALPGPIDSHVSNGPNVLIKSGAAELLASINDIFEKIGEAKQIELNFKNNNANIENLTEKQKEIYNLISSCKLSFDKLLQKTNTDVQELLKHLSILELKGIIEKTTEGEYAVC